MTNIKYQGVVFVFVDDKDEPEMIVKVGGDVECEPTEQERLDMPQRLISTLQSAGYQFGDEPYEEHQYVCGALSALTDVDGPLLVDPELSRLLTTYLCRTGRTWCADITYMKDGGTNYNWGEVPADRWNEMIESYPHLGVTV